MTNLPLQVVLHRLHSQKTLITLLFLVFLLVLCFQGFFSSKERLKERKTDTEELIGRTQSNTSPTKPRDTRLKEDLQPISLTSPPLITAVGHLQACLLVKDIQWYFDGYKELLPLRNQDAHMSLRFNTPCPRLSCVLPGIAENTGRMTLVNGGHL